MKAPNFARRLLRSSSAATFSQVVRMVVTFGTQMVLRRLILPEDWGLWHWAVDFLFVLFAQMRDLGVPAHVVRDRDRPYGTFLGLQIGWGAFLALAIAMAAPWLAATAADPHPAAIPVLQALTLFLLLEGLGKVPLTFFEAEIALERALVPEVARNLVYAAVAILLAWRGFDIWSLVIAHLVSTALFTFLVWRRAWGEMPLDRPKDAPEVGRLVVVSLPLMLMAFLLLGIEWVDIQLATVLFSAKIVGFYGGALYLATMAPRAIEWPLRRALYPSFVAVRADPERFFETYRLATVLLIALLTPVAWGLYWNAETILVVLWGEDYRAAAGFLRLLGFVPLVQPFVRCAEDVLLARHEERILIAATTINVIVLVVAGILLGSHIGPIGIAWAKLLPIGSLLVTWSIYRAHPPGFRRLCGDLLFVYAVGAALFAAAAWIAPGPGWRFLLCTVAGLAGLAIVAWRFGDGFRVFFRQEDPEGDPTIR